MTRFYATTPIYYVNDEPHIGHAYTTIVGDALHALAPPLGEDVKFLTGTDEHGQKIEQRPPPPGARRRSWPTASRRACRGVALAEHRQRRLHPHHRTAPLPRPSASCSSAAMTPATSSSTSTSGKYCVRCEAYYTDDDLLPGGLCPIHKLPVDELEEENYFFRLSRFGDRLLGLVRRPPRCHRARVPRQRGARADPLRAARLLRQPHEHRVGRPAPVGPEARRLRVVRRPHQLPHARSASRRRASSFEHWWPVDVHIIGKDIIRFHCVYWPAMLMSAGISRRAATPSAAGCSSTTRRCRRPPATW